MTFKYKNVYVGATSTVTGPYEKKGLLGKYYDKCYDDLYFNENTWEQAEVRSILDSIEILLKKINKKKSEIDLHLGGDLLNQIVATNYASSKLEIPFIGLYSACATSTSGISLAACLIDNKKIKNAIVTSSSHNNGAEKQYRNPVEYGAPKKNYTTFTVTGCGSIYLTKDKSKIKVESSTIGSVVDMGITDVSNMGAVMAPAAAKTIYEHLKDTKRNINYYDLVLTGDLGMVGKSILKEYMKEEYKMSLNNYEDSGCIIFDIKKQKVYQGGSGVACLPLVSYSYIIRKMLEGKYKKVLLVATGALMNTTMCNQKLSIPAIAHAVSLEVV